MVRYVISPIASHSPEVAAIEVDLDDVTFSATNTLSIELGGLAPGTGYDKPNISGVATLDGTLVISLINSFTPQVGDELEIMTYASATGEFAETTGRLFDGNKALVKVHRANGLTLFATYRGDISLDGLVDGADYTLWADHYLEGCGSGGGSVPEPAALALLSLGSLALSRGRRGQRRA